MKERARELKAEARRVSQADGKQDVLAKTAEMQEPDCAMAERIRALVKANRDEGTVWPVAFALKKLTATT